MQLYKIANDFKNLSEMDAPYEQIVDALNDIEGAFEDKVEQMLAIIKNELAYADALKEEAKSLTERAKVAENKVDNLKRYILTSMATADKKTIKAGLQSVTYRSPSKVVEITSEDDIPVDFFEFVTSKKFDMKAIKASLKADKEVPGVALKDGKPSLIIK